MSDHCQCCIVGAGPAGVMLGLLLARKGVSVRLLEAQADLDRDFRGDTVHASTLEVLEQIGLAEKVLEIPHSKMRNMVFHTPKHTIEAVAFSRLKTPYPYVAMMPQVNFLNLLVETAEQYSNFQIDYHCAVTGLEKTGDRVSGVKFRSGGEDKAITADLVVAADGRFSKMRRMANLSTSSGSPPMDVCWLRFSRNPEEPDDAGAFYIADGRMCILLARDEEWQVGYVLPKGDFQQVKRDGIEQFRSNIATCVPQLKDRVHELGSFDDVHLLNIKSDRLDRWYVPGLLFIGDAAHVMSPVGGVGINYAIGDAVEAANVLLPRLGHGAPAKRDLQEIQTRRESVVRRMQRIQSMIQSQLVALALKNKDFELPLIARILLKIPYLRDIPPRIIALGFGRLRLEDP